MDSILKQMFGGKIDPQAKMLIGLLMNSMLSSNKSLVNFATYDTDKSLTANLQSSINKQLYKNTFGDLAEAQANLHTKDLIYNLYTKGFGFSQKEATNAMNSEGMRFVNYALNSTLAGTVPAALSNIYGTAFNRRYIAGEGLTNMSKYANAYRVVGEQMLNEHFVNKSFGSLGINDVSDVYSALMRTGKYDHVGGVLTDTTKEDEVERIAKARAQRIATDAKQYSKALSTLKDTLGGSIKDIISNVEALFQTSLGSISPQQLQNMVNNVAHSSNITGVSSGQMALMARGVYTQIQPYGGDSMMAAQIAMNSTYSMINDPRTYGLSKDRYNAAVLSAHTNKVLNGNVQYMAAAYQAWADKNGANATDAAAYSAFLKDLQDNKVNMTSAGLTGYMRKLGRSNEDIAALVGSDYTSRLGAQFNMSGVMFTQQNNTLNAQRTAYLDNQFGAGFVKNVLGGTEALSEMTDDDVRDAVFKHLTTRANNPMSKESARIISDRMGKYMRISARAALGNVMGEKESLEFMRNQATAERASKTQLWSTGVIQAFRDGANVGTNGVEGLKQLLMSDKTGDIGISSVLSVGLLGIDTTAAAEHMKKIGGLQGAEREQYIKDNLLTDKTIATQYRKVFGKDPGNLSKDQQLKELRTRLITESEDSAKLLKANRTANSTITQQSFQAMQANAVTILARLRRNPKDAQALAELGAYVNNKVGVEVSEELTYAYKNGMVDSMFTEKGMERIAQSIRMDKSLDALMKTDKYKGLSEDKQKALRDTYKQAANVLTDLSKEDRVRLREAMQDGKLTTDEIKGIQGLDETKSSALQKALENKDTNAAKEIFSELMDMSSTEKNTANLWETLFQLIREVINAING